MRVTWRGLELPTSVEKDVLVSTDKYGKFYVEPFERGFGTTIGNSLRRVLLSSLEGSAVTSIKMDGVSHEFTPIPGVMEDVTEIVLNIKNLVVKLESDEPKVVNISANKQGTITAADIEADPAVEIIDRGAVIATLTEDVEFNMEMTIEKGRGYVPASERIASSSKYDQELGVLILDALYSPVTRVRYTTENTRVGQKTNYDKLIIEIWTDGTISPERALVESGKILRKHINPFTQYSDLGEETVVDEIEQLEEVEEEKVDEELIKKLQTPLADLELSVRATNCVESIKLETVGEIVSMTEADLLKIRSFGKTSLREIKRKLADMGLSLGMTDIEKV